MLGVGCVSRLRSTRTDKLVPSHPFNCALLRSSRAKSRDVLPGVRLAFWCYILKCADGRYYTGHTDDLDRRIAEHQTGGFCDFTSRRRPVQLVWSEYFQTRLEALEVEARVKPWSRAKKEGLIAGDWKQVSYFARPPRERPSAPLGTNGGDSHSPIIRESTTEPVRAEQSRGTLPRQQ